MKAATVQSHGYTFEVEEDGGDAILLVSPNLRDADRLPDYALLDLSIAKWQAATDYLSKYGDVQCLERLLGTRTCALCINWHSANCEGCPVRARTGRPCCHSTPFDVVCDADTDARLITADMCRAELEFLKSLRPDLARDLWAALGDVPIDANEDIEEPFLHFEPGTNRLTIWHWFESHFDVAVRSLMYPKGDGSRDE